MLEYFLGGEIREAIIRRDKGSYRSDKGGY